jgi:diaminopimelate decarboxylase
MASRFGVGCMIDAWKVKAVRAAVQSGVLSETRPLALFYDWTRYRATAETLKRAFPTHWLHAMAVKANPFGPCLREMDSLGITFECASLGELKQALAFSSDRERVVFDSPAKSRQELRFALEQGVYLNIDNWQELDRVTELISGGSYPHAKIGLRINPQVGIGRIPAMSTAGPKSKFGIGFDDYQERILRAFADRPWLTGVHCHVGSQGCPYDLIVQGIERTVEIARMVNKQRSAAQIKFIDIGGGLPVNFASEEDVEGEAIAFDEWARRLSHIPELFNGEYTVITEFGRRLNAKAGFIASFVEYTKQAGGAQIAVIHGGADLFVRTVYAPDKWPLRVNVFDRNGELKDDRNSQLVTQEIAGPCCFAGDMIAQGRELPLIEPGDFVIAHDTGAYYYSGWSYYNSRQAPAIISYEQHEPIKFNVLREAASVEETLQFFNEKK